MLEIPEKHVVLKRVIGSVMILLAFGVLIAGAALINEKQILLVIAVSVTSIILAIFGSILLAGKLN